MSEAKAFAAYVGADNGENFSAKFGPVTMYFGSAQGAASAVRSVNEAVASIVDAARKEEREKIEARLALAEKVVEAAEFAIQNGVMDQLETATAAYRSAR